MRAAAHSETIVCHQPHLLCGGDNYKCFVIHRLGAVCAKVRDGRCVEFEESVLRYEQIYFGERRAMLREVWVGRVQWEKIDISYASIGSIKRLVQKQI